MQYNIIIYIILYNNIIIIIPTITGTIINSTITGTFRHAMFPLVVTPVRLVVRCIVIVCQESLRIIIFTQINCVFSVS